MSSTTSPDGKIPQILSKQYNGKLILLSGVDPPFSDLVARENSANSDCIGPSGVDPPFSALVARENSANSGCIGPSGVDPPFSDLVARENSANSDSMSSPGSESSFQETKPLRPLLPKPGVDMAEHVRRLSPLISPLISEEDGEPDKPIDPKDLQLPFLSGVYPLSSPRPI